MDGFFIRADKGDAGVLAGFGETGIFREETIAWVHRVGAALATGIQQGFHIQVGGAGQGRAYTDGFVSQLHMTGTRIRLGIDRHGPVAQ